MEVKPAGGMTRSARVSIFVNVVLICALGTLLALALLWLVSRLSWSHDVRIDLTRDERFSIDPLAETVLRSLKEPVHATLVYGIDDEIRKRALDPYGQPRADVLADYYRPLLTMMASRAQVILTEWSRISENFTFDMVDADLDPQRMGELAQRQGRTTADLVRAMNQVVFDAGARRRTTPLGRMFPVDWGFISPDPRGYSNLPQIIGQPRVQSELTETLRALAAGEALKVGIPQGIASSIPLDGPAFKRLRDFLLSQGFEPVAFELSKGVPADVALVAIIGMGRRLLPDEAAELKRYEGSGGRMLLLADPRKPEDFGSVLSDPYGVKIEAAQIEDPARAAPRQANQSLILSNELCVGNHEIDRPVKGIIGIFIGVTRPLKIETFHAEGAERIVLLEMSQDAKAIPIEYREQTGEPDFLVAAKRTAPKAPIAAALRRPGKDGKETRIVVFGGSEVINPAYVESGTNFGNRDLILNALNWLADRKAGIGIVEREIASRKVELTPGFLSTFRWLTLLAFPALVFLGGFFVWWSRRR